MAVRTLQCCIFVVGMFAFVSSKKMLAGTIVFDPLPTEPTYNTSTEGSSLPLSSWYGLATGFIHKVPPKEIPWEVMRGIINGTMDVTNNYTQFVSYSAGFITCFAVAIIFIILMPLIGMVFCCCRCCDNCGGKMLQRDKYNTKCRRVVFVLLLLVTTVLMTFGLICGFTSNAEMSRALRSADSTLDSNVQDLSAYIDHTFEQFDFLVYNQYDIVHEKLISDLNDVGQLVVKPIKEAADSQVEPAIDGALQLATASVGIQSVLRDIVNLTQVLTQHARLLQQALDMERNAFNFTLQTPQCRSSAARACLQLRNISNLHLLTLAADFNIIRVEAELQKVDQVLQANITELAYRGKAEYDNITSRINSDSIQPVTDLKVQLENVRSSMQSEVTNIQTEVNTQVDAFLDLISTDANNSSSSILMDGFETAQSYDEYRFFAGIALCCVILITILCNYLGIIFGECGRDTRDRPTERGCLANMGGTLLLTGVTLTFIFSPLIMLVTTLSFLVGGASEKAICKPVETGDIFREVIDYPYLLNPEHKYWLSALLNQESNIHLTAEEVISGCEANGAIYKVLKLDNLFNLTAELDYRQKYPELQRQLNTFNISLAGLKLIDDATITRLNQVRDSGINAVNYSLYLSEVRKGITNVNLSTVSTTIETAAQHLSDKSLQSQLKSHATNLRRIQEDTINPMEGYVQLLEQQILTLQKEAVNITDTVNRTIEAVLDAQDFLITKGGEIVTQEIKSFANRLMSYVDQFVDYFLDVVSTHLGRCEPIANVYRSFDVLVCSNTVDALNGYWFALGWCILLYIPSLIFAVKLSKFYRRMRYFEDYFNTIQSLKASGSYSTSV